MLRATFEQPLKGELVECDDTFITIKHSKMGEVVIPLSAVSCVYGARGGNIEK